MKIIFPHFQPLHLLKDNRKARALFPLSIALLRMGLLRGSGHQRSRIGHALDIQASMGPTMGVWECEDVAGQGWR